MTYPEIHYITAKTAKGINVRICHAHPLTTKELLQMVVDGSTITAEQIEAVWNSTFDCIARALAQSRPVIWDGFGEFRNKFSGVADVGALFLPHEDISLETVITADPQLAHRVAEHGEFVEGSIPSCEIHAIEDNKTQRKGYSPAGRITVRGKGLTFSKKEPDEGLFLILPDGSEIRLEKYTDAKASQFITEMPADVQGPCEMVMRTRYKTDYLLRSSEAYCLEQLG